MSHRPIGRGPALAGLAALTAALTACGSGESPAAVPPASAPAQAATVPVVASTNVYGSVVRAVGGDRVQVTSIIDSPDADPHDYEATPADALAVTRAQLVVMNGGGYDDFATRLVESAGTAPRVVDVVALSGLQPAEEAGGAGEEHAGEDHAGAEHDHGGFNEHVWYSLPTMSTLADRVAADLGAVDPAGAATYTANAAAFRGRIDGLVAEVEAIRAARAGTQVAITEPVPLYLLDAAGLQNATPEEFSEAVEEGSDPSAAVLGETLRIVSGGAVEALLTNTQTESPVTQQVERVATAAGVPVVTVTETLPDGVDDYVTWQSGQIDALRTALGTAA